MTGRRGDEPACWPTLRRGRTSNVGDAPSAAMENLRQLFTYAVDTVLGSPPPPTPSTPTTEAPPATVVLALAVTLSLVSLVLFGFALTGVGLSRLGTNGGGGYSTRVLGWDNLRGEFGWLGSVCIAAPLLLPLPITS